MLTNASFLDGLVVHALDGDIGTVEQFLFDDETWAIRYLSVETGGWLTGRQVLISPFSILNCDWHGKRLDVSLTRSQIEKSPDIDARMPVSRQHEADFLGYYGYPYYWGGPYLWGPTFYPAVATPVTEARLHSPVAGNESHLRSSEAVSGYHIEATDGEIGHLDGFVIDEECWSIRYVEVATRNWLPGKKVLLAPEWIDRVSWNDSKVYAAVSKDIIQNAPEYLMSRPLSRDYEEKLYAYYGQPPYWLEKEHRRFSSSRTGA
jgi:hypothetical protein